MKYYVEWAGATRVVEIRSGADGLVVVVDDVEHPVDVATVDGGELLNLIVDGESVTYAARFENGDAVLSFHDREVRVGIEDERTRMARLATGGGPKGKAKTDVKSVMPGVVKEVRVAEGESVSNGQPLLILEAMKMENEIRAPADGLVEKVHVAPGQAVDKGAPLVNLKPPEAG
ncbi:MAG: acetyl-CoA carboxylase biotin carboxyl carrier protein subunit [Planctomycetota bacterium]|nr:acetyl-CoA carboxylase biotin carboxyl carrier protein subunit [Planctomycetota bacterium]